MVPEAYTLHASFDAAGPAPFRMDRHYLLYALSGTLRLDARGRSWSLPPARAALIRAGEPVVIAVLTRLTAASALFAPGFVPDPWSPLAVFDMPPLGRELVLACRANGPDQGPLDDHARTLFQALAAVAWRAARTPVPTSMPLPRSPPLMRALALTEQALDRQPVFPDIARGAGLSPRALARLFQAEMGMTWREALRRLRLIRAAELLASTRQSVAEVAFSVGYGSLSAFGSAFLAHFGQTPSQYRDASEP